MVRSHKDEDPNGLVPEAIVRNASAGISVHLPGVDVLVWNTGSQLPKSCMFMKRVRVIG